MIAYIALIRRMPRKIDALDYAVPESMTVSRGDIVLVPFRTALVRGVVLKLYRNSDPVGADPCVRPNLKPIVGLKQKNAVSDEILSLLESQAKELIQSVSSLLHGAFSKTVLSERPSQTKLRPTIRRSEVSYIQQAIALAKSSESCFISAVDFVQAAAIVEALKKSLPGPCRVFVPYHHDALCVDGASTRTAALKTDAKTKLDVVLRSGAQEHASYDRNPRYDARELMRGKVVFIDVCPRVSDLVRFENVLDLPKELLPETVIVDLEDQKKSGMSGLISHPLLDGIEKALQSKKKVLISYNRKGTGTRLHCQDCGFEPRCKSCGAFPTVYETSIECHHCGTSAPLFASCPKCGGMHVMERGVGNRQIEKRLLQHFPEAKITRVEKGSVDAQQIVKADIILATRYYLDAVLNPFDPPVFGLVAELLPDLGLSDPSFEATEQTLRSILEWRGVAARAKCPFLVQTFEAELMKRMIEQPLTFLEQERADREAVGFPPYGTIYKLTTRGKTTLTEVKTTLQTLLVGLQTREHTERKKPILEIYVKAGMIGSLRSALKQLKDDVIIEVKRA